MSDEMLNSEGRRSRIQELLLQARRLLIEAGDLADECGEDIHFMGLVFESHVGWFTPDGGLQQESDWNDSACVIGSRYAEGYGMEGWKDAPKAENLDPYY